jgi:transcriptional regulator with PAS, ATPase and Fis domain
MSPRVQVRVLRVLQEGEFEPVGGTQTLQVNVRIVAATNTDLKEAIREGKFRQDLFYRLHVVPIHLPPLRDRREDIPLLVDHFLEKYNRENGKSVTRITRDVLDRLLEYSWPGNVRELENAVCRAIALTPEAGELRVEDLLRGASSTFFTAVTAPGGITGASPAGGSTPIDGKLAAAVAAAERAAIVSALAKTGGSRTEAAKILGVSRKTLWEKMGKLDIKD